MASASGSTTNITSEMVFRPNSPLFYKVFREGWESTININISRVPHPRSDDPLVSYNQPTDNLPFIRGKSNPKPTYLNREGFMELDFYGVPDKSHFYFSPILYNSPFLFDLSTDTAQRVSSSFPMSMQEFARLPQPYHFISHPGEFDAYRTAETRHRYSSMFATSPGGNPSALGSGNPAPVSTTPQANSSTSEPTGSMSQPTSGQHDTSARVSPIFRSTRTSPPNRNIFPRPVPFLAPCAAPNPGYKNDFCAYRISLAIQLKEFTGDCSPTTTVQPASHDSLSSEAASREWHNRLANSTHKEWYSDPLPPSHEGMVRHFLNHFVTSGYFERLKHEMLNALQHQEIVNLFAPEVTISKTDNSHTREDCCICLAELKVGHATRKMPCKHQMHRECIDTWLEGSNKCPLCRTVILPDDLDG